MFCHPARSEGLHKRFLGFSEANVSSMERSNPLLTGGDYNIDIGNIGAEADSGTIRIGATGNQANTYIAGISGVAVAGGVGGTHRYRRPSSIPNSSTRARKLFHYQGTPRIPGSSSRLSRRAHQARTSRESSREAWTWLGCSPSARMSLSHYWSMSRCQLHTPDTYTWPGRCRRWNRHRNHRSPFSRSACHSGKRRCSLRSPRPS
jgi:hypothetical protein